MGIPSFAGRVGLAGGHSHTVRSHEKRACNLANGDLYVYPKSTDKVDATKPVTFKWDSSCPISSSQITLSLYGSGGVIKQWGNKDFSAGELTVTFQPKWWNDTETAQLQMNIVESDLESWMSNAPAGPVFSVSYPASAMFSTTTANGQVKTSTAAAAATQSKDAVFEDVSSTNASDKSGISKGAIAAAVIVPLLVIAVLVAVAVKFWRNRENEKRKRWSQALSTHSNIEWEKGALPGEKPRSILGRPSMGGRPSMSGGDRPSMSTYGGSARPSSSVYAVENNMAGAGAGAGLHFQRPDLASLRTQSAENVNRSSLAMPDGNVRQSRISFAESARPDRRSRLSFGGDIKPNVHSGVFKNPGASRSAHELNSTPTNRRSLAYATGSAIDDDDEIQISPSQLQGPHGFDQTDMKRVGKGTRTGRRSFMSLGGGDKRRESSASALSADDFKSAASARGSVDELRDMEAVMLMRRSMISQASQRSPNPAMDNNSVEALDNAPPVPMAPSAPSPIAGSSTVAYGPDQMLAVYAARGKVANSAPSTPTFGTAPQAQNVAQPKPTASRQNSGMRLLTSLGGKKNSEDSTGSMPPPSAPAPGDMRSFVHLNNGTVSSSVIDALPAPGPRGVTSPTGERPTTGLTAPSTKTRASGLSEGSRYSQTGEDEEDIGEAQ
ncbi:hypothetical protein I302_103609 [Kwoniella bestiolae CBS 10118]|uniref:Uncharacterized protein n=1 Tax=Kwoniella bestiolae CBS 10118 TaxID=1296100 RepID=A0A1B9G8Y1_9TREE|nr:hypothetical protein I302_02311 [Kwoniella bestiolae CBS 10118]OCF27469.1 hypothetical protein I302_02311 [Kwoniella bestiolae CBS 10118]